MSDKHSFVSRGRLLVVLLLLCAMLLSGCGSIVEGLLGPRGEESAPPAADEPAPTAAAEIEPTPEPTPEPYRTTVILSELQAANKATVTDRALAQGRRAVFLLAGGRAALGREL